MNPLKLKKLSFLIFFILNYLSVEFLIIPKSFSSSISQTNLSEHIKNKNNNEYYILGPGDILSIEIVDAQYFLQGFTNELKSRVIVNSEGTITLPRLNKIYVSGLTLEELTTTLNKEYENYLLNPDVKINVIEYRDISIRIEGEVNNTGFFTIKKNKIIDPSKKISSISINTYFPRIVDVIREAGGVTINADLENVKVRRINSLSNGGGYIETNISLLDIIENNNNIQNLRIYDGDYIFVNKGDGTNISSISKAIRSNINPNKINVFISGRVNQSGIKQIPKLSTINELITIAGGLKKLRGEINLVRSEEDGTGHLQTNSGHSRQA